MSANYVAGLRALASWYEAHPDVPAPEPTQLNVFTYHTKEEAATAARALGAARKEYTDNGLLFIRRDFGGGVTLAFVFSRESVCVRKVVGTVTVPEKVTPAHEIEIVEWECEPVLDAAPESEPVSFASHADVEIPDAADQR